MPRNRSQLRHELADSADLIDQHRDGVLAGHRVIEDRRVECPTVPAGDDPSLGDHGADCVEDPLGRLRGPQLVAPQRQHRRMERLIGQRQPRSGLAQQSPSGSRRTCSGKTATGPTELQPTSPDSLSGHDDLDRLHRNRADTASGTVSLPPALESTFPAYCEHYLAPFHDSAHIAYIPNDDGRVIGLSKFARLIDGYAQRPQVQERLTSQVADALDASLSPKGVMVVIEAEHLCMSMRGVKKAGTTTVTSAVRGLFRNNVATREEAMRFIQGR